MRWGRGLGRWDAFPHSSSGNKDRLVRVEYTRIFNESVIGLSSRQNKDPRTRGMSTDNLQDTQLGKNPEAQWGDPAKPVFSALLGSFPKSPQQPGLGCEEFLVLWLLENKRFQFLQLTLWENKGQERQAGESFGSDAFQSSGSDSSASQSLLLWNLFTFWANTWQCYSWRVLLLHPASQHLARSNTPLDLSLKKEPDLRKCGRQKHDTIGWSKWKISFGVAGLSICPEFQGPGLSAIKLIKAV